LKIVVCVKQVPDSAARVVVENGKVSWGDAPLVINPWDEYAVESAMRQKELYGGDVIAVTVGGESAREALKHALAMGCAEAILISDPALVNADSLATARVLAAAIQKIGGVDVGVTAAQTGRVLGWPALTLVSVIENVDLAGGSLRVQRTTEEGRQILESRLPAVISVLKDIGEPRYPSFMGIRKAARATIPVWGMVDLGISAPQPLVRWPEVLNPPRREVKTEFVTGSNPQEVAENLAEAILGEKVL
jgi:electron transfer flavoprotein beta subunit